MWQTSCATSKFIAYATEAGGPAYGFLDADGWQGLFTIRLLSILRQAPSGILASALKDHLECEVRIDASDRGVLQRAKVHNGLASSSSFGRRGAAPWLELRFVKRRGSVVLRGGNLEIVDRIMAGEKPWRCVLPVGLYLIEGGGQDAALVKHDGRGGPHDV